MARRANEASWFYHKRGEQIGTSENPGRPAPAGDPAAAAPLGFSTARRPGQYHSRASSTAVCPKSGRPRQRPCWCHGLNRATAPVRACRRHVCLSGHLPCRARPAHRGRGAGASTSATSPASWLSGCLPRQSPVASRPPPSIVLVRFALPWPRTRTSTAWLPSAAPRASAPSQKDSARPA